MTIKVCKEKFNKNVIKSITVFYYIIVIGLIGFIPIGMYAIQNNIGLDPHDHSIGWLGIFIGVMSAFILVFIGPWVSDQQNLISKLNSKCKIFGWNKDC